MTITTKTPASAGNATSKTTVADASAGNATSKTVIADASAGNATSKTTIADASAGNATSKTAVSAVSAGNATSKTVIADASAGNATAKTVITAASIPRALTPVVHMHFDSQNYSLHSNPIEFSDLFTYSRDSTASFMNRRIVNNRSEYFRDADFVGTVTNLLTYSEQLDNAAYTEVRATLTPDITQSPINDMTADKMTEDSTASATHHIRRSESFTSGTDYTISIFVKADERSQIAITAQAPAVTGGYRAIFDLSNNIVLSRSQSDYVASVWSVGDGWSLCSITFNADATNSANVEFEISKNGTVTYNGDNSSGLYLWGAQITESVKPLPYVKTTSASDSLTFTESLRIEYNPETGENLGALIEGNITNLVTRSEEFDHADWTLTNGTVTANASKAIDGTTSADKFEEDATAGNHEIGQSFTPNADSIYTVSCDVKAVELSIAMLRFNSGIDTVGSVAQGDFTTGSFAVSSGAGIARTKNLGDGWYRISLTLESDSLPGSTQVKVGTRTGSSADTGEGILIASAQLEEFSLPSSYIRTEGSTVAKLSDDLSMGYINLMGVSDFTIEAMATAYTISSGTTDNRHLFSANGKNSTEAYLRLSTADDLQNKHGGTGNAIETQGNYSTEPLNTVYSFTASTRDRRSFIDGTFDQENLDTVLFQQAVTDDIGIGSRYNATQHFFGNIKELSFYDVTATDQEVALL